MAEIKISGATWTFVEIFYRSLAFAALVFSLPVVWFVFFFGGCVWLVWILFCIGFVCLFVFALKLPTVHLLFIGMMLYAMKT